MKDYLLLREKLQKTSIAIQQSIGQVERMIEQLEMDVLRATGLSTDYLCIGSHKCMQSPIELCVYDDMNDAAWDECIFCHDPHERK